MKIKEVLILKDAVNDLNDGKSFYDNKETGVGDYFWDTLLSDIESLVIYAGIHGQQTIPLCCRCVTHATKSGMDQKKN